MFIIMFVENLCHIIETPWFWFYMDFATFKISTVKFPVSRINLWGMDLRYLSPETEQEFPHIGIPQIKYKRKKTPKSKLEK